MIDYVEIGSKIRAFRKAKGLSQEQLAERIWISTTHMSHIETGSTKLSLPVLVDISEALEVGVDDIISTKNSEKKQQTESLIQSLLNNCTPQHRNVLEQIVIAAKKALEEYIT